MYEMLLCLYNDNYITYANVVDVNYFSKNSQATETEIRVARPKLLLREPVWDEGVGLSP